MPHQDHPRLCGNDYALMKASKDIVGSPPLVRERLFFFSQTKVNLRITPACAGTT